MGNQTSFKKGDGRPDLLKKWAEEHPDEVIKAREKAKATVERKKQQQ